MLHGMAAFNLNRILRITLLAGSAVVIAGLGVAWRQQTRTVKLTLAAGAPSGESYLLGKALKTVVERHYPKIRVTLVATGGTTDNLRMLDEGRAQLATAQADILPGPKARLVAVLYDDTLQLLVPISSPAQGFLDLRGRRIALTQSGGQYQSFLHVAEHFGLGAADFQFVGTDDEDAGDAFVRGQADAIFRVRALGDPSIQRLVRAGKVRFLAIDHAAAMKIKYPAFAAALIPVGAYLGNPPVPAQDVPTVAVERTLLASDAADVAAVRAITGVLLERRQEMMEEIPPDLPEVRLLLVHVRRPVPQTGLGPALHPGALSFYDKDKPSFLLAHADYVGLILTVGLMAGSWVWELKRWMQRKQKDNAELYINRVLGLITRAQEVQSVGPLDEIWGQLLTILTEAVRDLDMDKLSEESFNSFRVILQIGMEVTRERRALVMAAVPLLTQ